MNEKSSTLLQQIDDALGRFEELRQAAPDHDPARLSRIDIMELVARLSATIEALTPDGHRYRKLTAVALKENHYENPRNLEALVGILKALRADLKAGYLRRWDELVRADLFSNLLDIAEHFLDEKFLPAAAVMAGGALEEHLRNLCRKHNVLKPDDETTYTSLRTLRESLFTEKYLAINENRSIKNWANIRNKAAHAEVTDITPEEVRLMIEGIQNFLSHHPA